MVFFFLLDDGLDAFLILSVRKGSPLRADPLNWLDIAAALERHRVE